MIIITPILCSKYIKFVKKTGNISVFHFFICTFVPRINNLIKTYT